jgi:hypothetical protein
VKIKQNYTQKEALSILKNAGLSKEDVNKAEKYSQVDSSCGISTVYYLLPNGQRISGKSKLGIVIGIIKGSHRNINQITNLKRKNIY